jgi:hypothetical protein
VKTMLRSAKEANERKAAEGPAEKGED